jgi:hypothetical protein
MFSFLFQTDIVYYVEDDLLALPEDARLEIERYGKEAANKYLQSYGREYDVVEEDPIDMWRLVDENTAYRANSTATASATAIASSSSLDPNDPSSNSSNNSNIQVTVRIGDLDIGGALQIKLLLEEQSVVYTRRHGRGLAWPRARYEPALPTAKDAKGLELKASGAEEVPCFVSLLRHQPAEQHSTHGFLSGFSCSGLGATSVKEAPETLVQPGEIGKVVRVQGEGVVLVRWELGNKSFRGEELVRAFTPHSKVFWSVKNDRDVPPGAPLIVLQPPFFNRKKPPVPVVECRHIANFRRGGLSGVWTFPASTLSITYREPEKPKKPSAPAATASTASSATAVAAAGTSNAMTTSGNDEASGQRVNARMLGGKVKSNQVGLQNMGNTCYLNASLQALSHITLLRDYLLSNDYLYDINVR